MEQLLTWAANYSMPVLILLAIGSAFTFVFQKIVEKAVEAQFDRRTKRIELLLEKRSNFEEKVLLDQYKTVADLQTKLSRVGADLRRARGGVNVKGLYKDNEILPLSAIFLELEAKQFLLRKEFHTLLLQEANNLLKFANTKAQEEASTLMLEYQQLNDEFHAEMNDWFGVDRICWFTLEGSNNSGD